MRQIPWRLAGDGIELSLRVTPNAAKNEIVQIETRAGRPVLRLRVTAPPERGKANKATIALLSKHLKVPKSAIAILSGETARDKTVSIAGEPARLTGLLEVPQTPHR